MTKKKDDESSEYWAELFFIFLCIIFFFIGDKMFLAYFCNYIDAKITDVENYDHISIQLYSMILFFILVAINIVWLIV